MVCSFTANSRYWLTWHIALFLLLFYSRLLPRCQSATLLRPIRCSSSDSLLSVHQNLYCDSYIFNYNMSKNCFFIVRGGGFEPPICITYIPIKVELYLLSYPRMSITWIICLSVLESRFPIHRPSISFLQISLTSLYYFIHKRLDFIIVLDTQPKAYQ